MLLKKTPLYVLYPRLFWVWSDMRQRCKNPAHKAYKNYGGRNITVCEAWKNSFENFVADMGLPPIGKMLDREDNDKGYSPENCRWVTRKEQNSNRRNCRYIMDNEEKITMREYCRRYNLHYRAILKRILYRGWSVEEAISTPMLRHRCERQRFK